MNILGLSGSTHDPAAALVMDGRVIAAIEEERITRNKHAKRTLPINSAREVLKIGKINPADVDLVAYFLDPNIFNKNVANHILKNYDRYIFQPNAYRTLNFLKRGRRYSNEALEVINSLGIKAHVEFVRHHLAHAATAFYLSPFDNAMIMTIDNLGELDSTLLATGNKNKINVLRTQRIPHSLGMLYATITDYLGFTAWDEEGKVMALAAYGTPTISLDEIINLTDGYFEIKKSFQMIETKDHDRLYSNELVAKYGPPRKKGELLTQRHKDIAASLQYACEEVAKNLVTWLHKNTGYRKLCLAGGVALNCKLNGELSNLPFVDEIYVTPAAGDAGSSLGAAVFSSVNSENKEFSALKTASLGSEYNNNDILSAIEKLGVNYKYVDDPSGKAAELLLNEKVICWFQGRTEFGPRALGNRSILAVPNLVGTKDYVNQYVKKREMWRPLCPSILKEKADVYFPNSDNSFFMNIAHNNSDLQKKLPDIFHVDGSARIQVVSSDMDITYSNLLKNVDKQINYPILINTSFNNRGEPIVNSPYDAILSFLTMPVNSLVIGNFYVKKK